MLKRRNRKFPLEKNDNGGGMKKKYFNIFLGITFILFLFSSAGFTQTSEELKNWSKELEELKESQKAIQKDLQQIKNILRSRGLLDEVPPNLFIDISSRPLKGDNNAKLTLMEFSEYQWPFCARYVRETWPQISKEYIETGKVKYLFFDFPLEAIHKNALKAAEASRCADEQGKYWEMHDQLFANQTALESGDLPRYATTLSLDPLKFQDCMESGRYVNEIRKDFIIGQKAGVRGTPTFLIGVSEGETSKVKVLKMIRGAQPYPVFKDALDSLPQ